MKCYLLLTALCMYVPCLRSNESPQNDGPVHSLSTEDRKPKYENNRRPALRHSHRGMVQALCKHGHIYSEVVRNAMLRVDRKNFFSKNIADPYRIKSRNIGFGADISSPHIHAQMLELLKDKIKPGARILDIGSGSGYLTACLAYMAGSTGRVYGVEHVMELAEGSIKNIDKGNSELLDQGRVQFIVWNGKHGYEREAPYDIIHVSPSYFTIPQKLLDQLVPGGRMIMPVGEPFKGQNLTIIDKLPDGYTIVTTVVRRVRTNPMYRDRFQQKKYFNEMRRKAQERYNASLAMRANESAKNLYQEPKSKATRPQYVFKTNIEEGQHFEGNEEEHKEIDHNSLTHEVWNQEEQNQRKNKKQPSDLREGEHTLAPVHMEHTTPKATKTPYHSDSDYEMRSTTQWRWRQHYSYRTNNWMDYDSGFNKENPYNIDGVDHGIKLDHTEGDDYIYPDYRNMTFFPKYNELWGNCDAYKKWYNDNYVGRNETPYNPLFPTLEPFAPKTKKPLPPNFFQDAARDSFPEHLFPFSDYFE